MCALKHTDIHSADKGFGKLQERAKTQPMVTLLTKPIFLLSSSLLLWEAVCVCVSEAEWS